MNFENAFDVAAPVQDVWSVLMDIERVAPCMPGAQVLEHVDDDTYKVGVRVKVGPISMLYRGSLEIVERDENALRATMRARAKEARGQGTADATVRMSLEPRPEGSHARIETELALSGRAAAMGRGVIVDVASNLIDEFASNLAGIVGGAPVAEPEATLESQPLPPPVAEALPEREPKAVPEREPKAVPEREPKAATDSSLPVGKIAASVIAGRLRDPRTLLLATATVAAVSGAIGYAIGRSR